MRKYQLFWITVLVSIFSFPAISGILSEELQAKLSSFEQNNMTRLRSEPTMINIQIWLNQNASMQKNNSAASEQGNLLKEAESLGIEITQIKFMPGLLIAKAPANRALLNEFVNTDKIDMISLIPTSHEELEVNTASILLKRPDNAPKPVSNWWNAGITGKKTVIAVLDSGVPDNYTDQSGQTFVRFEGLKDKRFFVNRGSESGFNNYLNGIRTAHGSGVACIYGNEQIDRHGIAFGAKDFLITLAGDAEVDNTDWSLTLKNIDWLLTDNSHPKPNTINYSFGNGDVYCPTCSNQNDWSSVAQTIDYIVEQYHITWVKSAGNTGWIPASTEIPFASKLSIPADSYNAIVVANMNTTLKKTNTSLLKTSDRQQHFIQSSSSRGPTLLGRRKPDITAPGNDTRTCAPDPITYAVTTNPTFKPYSASMQYDATTQTRLAGGTSMATPHVGGATALLFDYGITAPRAIKALLINSADTWTDNNQPGPGDLAYSCEAQTPNCGHGKILGSQWNRTYGWGYLNLDAAYKQRRNLIQNELAVKKAQCYSMYAKSGDKITVVWERRFDKHQGTPEKFTPFQLQLFNAKTFALLDSDTSRIDNVLQIANYPRNGNILANYPAQQVIAKLSIPHDIKQVAGRQTEPFTIVGAESISEISCPAQIDL